MKFIGHLGKQDSDYDNTLAEFAEYSHVLYQGISIRRKQ
jgi:hypothetical protein